MAPNNTNFLSLIDLVVKELEGREKDGRKLGGQLDQQGATVPSQRTDFLDK